MAKERDMYACSNCGHREPKWSGRCPHCGEWNTFAPVAAADAGRRTPTPSVPLDAVPFDAGRRIGSGDGEVDRVLGGGLVPGSSVLVGGEPGIGKSTLMLQIAAGVESKGRALYVSGEESAAQIRMRAERLGAVKPSIEVLCETDAAAIGQAMAALRPVVVVVDSLQTVVSSEVGAVPGTINQVRYGCHEIVARAKEHGATVFLVAHVTKEGDIAGPKLVEHMVDTVLSFDQGDSDLRILRAVKNRFGSVDEIGLFTMGEAGLTAVANPSSRFLLHRNGSLPPGVIVAPVYEGSRVLLIEIQALVVPAKGAVSRVFSDRIDARRVSRTAAVLEKHVSLRFSDQDMYVNVAGGIRIDEVGIELPLALALYSARTSLPLPVGTAAAGELTLAGEVRPIAHMRRRLRACEEIGYDRLVGPPAGESEAAEWIAARSVKDGVAFAFEPGGDKA